MRIRIRNTEFFLTNFNLAQGGKAEAGEDAASYNLGKNYRNSVRRDADKVCLWLFELFVLFYLLLFLLSLQLLCSLVSFSSYLALYLITLFCSFFVPISRIFLTLFYFFSCLFSAFLIPLIRPLPRFSFLFLQNGTRSFRPCIRLRLQRRSMAISREWLNFKKSNKLENFDNVLGPYCRLLCRPHAYDVMMYAN
jgi:hypothetical protein